MTSDVTATSLATLERHWQALLTGDLPALLADYAPDAILITGATGVSNGRQAIGELLSMFVTQILPPPNTRFNRNLTHVEGALGYIVWSAESATHRIPFGSDTFVFAGPKIIMQTSAGTFETK